MYLQHLKFNFNEEKQNWEENDSLTHLRNFFPILAIYLSVF